MNGILTRRDCITGEDGREFVVDEHTVDASLRPGCGVCFEVADVAGELRAVDVRCVGRMTRRRAGYR